MRKVIVVIALLAFPLFAQQAPCDVHSVMVTGMGSVQIAPDRVSFTVGVFTNAQTVSAAFQTNNEKTHRVVAALKARGVKDSEIQTSNFSIDSAWEETPGVRKRSGYNVTNSVTVTREDTKGVSDLIQAAVDAGANEANGMRFFNATPSAAAARERAIELAVRDARAQADKLAAATGTSVGRVIAMATSEGFLNAITKSGGLAESITVTAAPDIEAGSNTISYSVTITYELK